MIRKLFLAIARPDMSLFDATCLTLATASLSQGGLTNPVAWLLCAAFLLVAVVVGSYLRGVAEAMEGER